MGRFGGRAAHHRGARFFEECGEHSLALKYASLAFEAVPSHGAPFQVLAKAATRAGDRMRAVRVVEDVAARGGSAEARAAWLLRAAELTGDGEEGARARADLLARAVEALPMAATVLQLHDAARAWVRAVPGDR